MSDMDLSAPKTGFEEFRRAWPVAGAATYGMAVGIGTIATYTSALFIPHLHAEFGLTGTAFGAAYFLSTISMAAAMPLVGGAVDRFGPRRCAAIGAVLLAICCALLGVFTHSIASYIALYIILGFFGAGSSAVAFTTPVSGWFVHARGLALGITQAGAGLGGIFLPSIITAVIAAYGWRAGYLAIAVLALSSTPISLLWLRDHGVKQAPRTVAAAVFPEVLKQPFFWLQMAAFSLMLCTFTGLLVHLVPMLISFGMTAKTAAKMAGVSGASVIVARLIMGSLADRVHVRWLAAGACLICGATGLSLASADLRWALLAAIGTGFAMGAEVDLVSYATARYFGHAVYGRAYAWQFGGMIAAAGLSPLWVGALSDRYGYVLALQVSAGMALITAILFMFLPAYPSNPAGLED